MTSAANTGQEAQDAINRANAERSRLYADLLRGRVSVKEYVACVMRQVNEALERERGAS